jgi:hypothetical protein
MANPNPPPPPEHGKIKKGEIRNPRGFHGMRFKEELAKLVEKKIADGQYKGLPKRTVICLVAIDQAMAGDAKARDWVVDRIEGKVLDRASIQEALGPKQPVRYEIHYVNDWRCESPEVAIACDGLIAPFLPEPNGREAVQSDPGAARDEEAVRSDVPAPEPGPEAPAPPPELRDPKGPEWIS